MSDAPAPRGRAPTWAYVVAAVVGSFAGNALDMVLIGGGHTFTKVGLVVGLIAVWGVGRLRSTH